MKINLNWDAFLNLLLDLEDFCCLLGLTIVEAFSNLNISLIQWISVFDGVLSERGELKPSLLWKPQDAASTLSKWSL